MGEDQAGYVTDALEMMGAGYASIEIEQAKTIISRRAGKMVSEDRPAFVKVSTAFKQELSVISGDALKVWLFIALSINRNTGKANPGLRTIATSVKLAINTVQKALKELEGMDLLTVDRESKRYNIYETPEYISANKAEPTVSRDDTPTQSVSNKNETVSNSAQSVSPSVILNQSNQNKPDLLDMLLENEAIAQPIRNACLEFETAMLGSTVSQWPWDSNSKWQKFAKWVAAQELGMFKDYAEWRKGDGKYHAMSNNKIRQDPQMFMDTGWPTFLAHVSMYSAQKSKAFAL
jgi:DNA-binding transcriptional regulator YhcF (GntR family)